MISVQNVVAFLHSHAIKDLDRTRDCLVVIIVTTYDEYICLTYHFRP